MSSNSQGAVKGAAKKAVKAARASAMSLTTGVGPSRPKVQSELTIFWDAFSPLSLNAVQAACAAGKSLDDIGITGDQAESFANKYNSIILRAPGKGPLATTTEARGWHTKPMSLIVTTVHGRAQL